MAKESKAETQKTTDLEKMIPRKAKVSNLQPLIQNIQLRKPKKHAATPPSTKAKTIDHRPQEQEIPTFGEWVQKNAARNLTGKEENLTLGEVFMGGLAKLTGNKVKYDKTEEFTSYHINIGNFEYSRKRKN